MKKKKPKTKYQEIYDLFSSGKSVDCIATELEIYKSTVNSYLKYYYEHCSEDYITFFNSLKNKFIKCEVPLMTAITTAGICMDKGCRSFDDVKELFNCLEINEDGSTILKKEPSWFSDPSRFVFSRKEKIYGDNCYKALYDLMNSSDIGTDKKLRRIHEFNEVYDHRDYNISQIKDILDLIRRKRKPNEEFNVQEIDLFDLITESLKINTTKFK